MFRWPTKAIPLSYTPILVATVGVGRLEQGVMLYFSRRVFGPRDGVL